MSSQSVRANKGTEGNILRDSLMTQSRYLSSFRSSMVMGRLDPPEQRYKVSSTLLMIHKMKEKKGFACYKVSVILLGGQPVQARGSNNFLP